MYLSAITSTGIGKASSIDVRISLLQAPLQCPSKCYIRRSMIMVQMQVLEDSYVPLIASTLMVLLLLRQIIMQMIHILALDY